MASVLHSGMDGYLIWMVPVWPVVGLSALFGFLPKNLETRLGGYVPHVLCDWTHSEGFVAGTRSVALSANPDFWTDGSLVRDEVTGVW